jgi:hypothetical protein
MCVSHASLCRKQGILQECGYRHWADPARDWSDPCRTLLRTGKVYITGQTPIWKTIDAYINDHGSFTNPLTRYQSRFACRRDE